MMRSHTCNELGVSDVGMEVTLCGWVHRRRDHGGVIFVDLRDRYGLTQVVSDPVTFADAHKVLDTVRNEYVLRITGVVKPRPDGQKNTNLSTGEIEIVIHDVEILNAAITPPFEIDQEKEVGEELRLKYRYLDLRKARMQKNIMLRHHVTAHIRNYFNALNFVEVETPILIKGTPEGSREYVVPSRLYGGQFYVLPQSPQQLKQLLMVAGYDRYYQIARCFRDEDQRGDRQPEFTQLDIEMSFISEEDIMEVNEKLLIQLVQKFAPEKKIMFESFPVLTYHEAMNFYGSDKPDIRFELKFTDASELFKNSSFDVFKKAVESGGVVKALKVPGGASFTRKEIDELTEAAKIYGAKGLAYVTYTEGEFKSSISKFLCDEEKLGLASLTEVNEGDIIFFTADKFDIACNSLGKVRLEVAQKLKLINDDIFAFCWVKDFPMFELDEETGKLAAVHHPFTSAKHVEDLENSPETALARAYDVVLNGVEVGGGSIRIHDSVMQGRIFDILSIGESEAQERFGHILQAFKYGAPPHGGIALGLDRLVMIFANEPNIREVIAFPKDQKARDLMLGAPSPVADEQLNELSLKIKQSS